MQITKQQDGALKAVDKWLKDYYTSKKPQPFFYLAGFAGTGKSTIARYFADNINGEVAYAAYTGKASLVMRNNGCIGAKTIHSSIYIAEQNKKTGEIRWHLNKINSPFNDCKLIVIDECSMVDEHLAKDVLSFGKPILVLGDPGQLPPPTGAGYFTNGKPDYMLTEIHRQSKDNPILHLATMVREGAMPDFGDYGTSKVVSKIASTDALNADQILVGRNVTKDDINTKMRKLLKRDPETPEKDDKIICTKNDHDLGIYNGQTFRVEQVLENNTFKSNFFHMRLNPEDDAYSLPILTKTHKSFFDKDYQKPDWKVLKNSQELIYGYGITVHKSQGSQFSNVLIYEESYCFKDVWQKWLYTAITRAQSSVTILRN